MDVFGFVQGAADVQQPFGVGGAADLPNGVRIGGLNADLELEQSAPYRGEKVDHLLVDQMGGQLKVEIGDAVVMFCQILPDGHGVLLGAVEGAVHKLDLVDFGIEKAL